MKKILLLIMLLFFMPITVLAVKDSDTEYEITDFIIDASLDTYGNMKVKEIIKVEGNYNSYTRDIIYRNSAYQKFTAKEEDFKSSDIYNPSNITLYKVGTIEYEGELNFDAFNKDINISEECLKIKNCYQKFNIKDGLSLKIYNETIEDTTFFYIEYLLGNVVVLHKDIAELYYNFINEKFKDKINHFKLRVILPNESKESIMLWTHILQKEKISYLKDEKENIYYGGYLEASKIDKNTTIDMRMLFPKNLINTDHYFLKKSNIEALNKILILENKKENPHIENKNNSNEGFIVNIVSYIYIIITICMIIYIHVKYDKEIKPRLKSKYYYEFIEDYDITHIEYLFNKNISKRSFITSILNMIYKKNISYKQTKNQDFELTLITKNNLNNSELKILDIIFNEIGTGNKTTLNKIKNYICNKKENFNKLYKSWKNELINECILNKFFIDNLYIKLYFSLYSLLGLMVIFIHISMMIFNKLTLVVFILTILYILYILSFTKRTKKGSIHYTKWKRFKKFLKDFEKIDNNKLPKEETWEKYLVYSNIFGLTQRLCEVMKTKSNNNFDYELYKTFIDNINQINIIK